VEKRGARQKKKGEGTVFLSTGREEKREKDIFSPSLEGKKDLK